MTAEPPSTSRRGRPKSADKEARRQAVLDAALIELVEHGYKNVTMLGIAQRASSSKETLYNWFGNREGLFTALIQDNGTKAAESAQNALDTKAEPKQVLVGFADSLLTLLTGDRSVALNRAAMTSPELSEILLEHGRYRVGPIVEEYLSHLNGEGVIEIDDPAKAFRTLYGLVLADLQILALLGVKPLSDEQAAQHSSQAVTHFLKLTQPRE